PCTTFNFSKMNEPKFLLEDFFCGKVLDKKELENGIARYKTYLDNNPLPIELWDLKPTVDYLLAVKRTVCAVGPYRNLKLLGIGKHINSNFVLHGRARILFEESILIPGTKIIRGDLHFSGKSGVDYVEHSDDHRKIEGEGCNVAPSFFKG